MSVDPCTWCGKAGAKQRCSRCRITTYCGLACQRSHWREHKSTCFSSANPNPSRLSALPLDSPGPRRQKGPAPNYDKNCTHGGPDITERLKTVDIEDFQAFQMVLFGHIGGDLRDVRTIAGLEAAFERFSFCVTPEMARMSLACAVDAWCNSDLTPAANLFRIAILVDAAVTHRAWLQRSSADGHLRPQKMWAYIQSAIPASVSPQHIHDLLEWWCLTSSLVSLLPALEARIPCTCLTGASGLAAKKKWTCEAGQKGLQHLASRAWVQAQQLLNEAVAERGRMKLVELGPCFPVAQQKQLRAMAEDLLPLQLGLAECSLQLGDAKGAYDWSASVLANDGPTSLKARAIMTESLLLQGRIEEAASSARAAVDLKDTAETRALLQEALSRLQDSQVAAKPSSCLISQLDMNGLDLASDPWGTIISGLAGLDLRRMRCCSRCAHTGAGLAKADRRLRCRLLLDMPDAASAASAYVKTGKAEDLARAFIALVVGGGDVSQQHVLHRLRAAYPPEPWERATFWRTLVDAMASTPTVADYFRSFNVSDCMDAYLANAILHAGSKCPLHMCSRAAMWLDDEINDLLNAVEDLPSDLHGQEFDGFARQVLHISTAGLDATLRMDAITKKTTRRGRRAAEAQEDWQATIDNCLNNWFVVAERFHISMLRAGPPPESMPLHGGGIPADSAWVDTMPALTMACMTAFNVHESALGPVILAESRSADMCGRFTDALRALRMPVSKLLQRHGAHFLLYATGLLRSLFLQGRWTENGMMTINPLSFIWFLASVIMQRGGLALFYKWLAGPEAPGIFADGFAEALVSFSMSVRKAKDYHDDAMRMFGGEVF